MRRVPDTFRMWQCKKDSSLQVGKVLKETAVLCKHFLVLVLHAFPFDDSADICYGREKINGIFVRSFLYVSFPVGGIW